MKIIVSKTEAETLLTALVKSELSDSHGVRTVGVDSVTINIPTPIGGKPTIDLMGIVLKVRSFPRHEKISTIKAVRQMCHDAGVECTLASAKAFVELI